MKGIELGCGLVSKFYKINKITIVFNKSLKTVYLPDFFKSENSSPIFDRSFGM